MSLYHYRRIRREPERSGSAIQEMPLAEESYQDPKTLLSPPFPVMIPGIGYLPLESELRMADLSDMMDTCPRLQPKLTPQGLLTLQPYCSFSLIAILMNIAAGMLLSPLPISSPFYDGSLHSLFSVKLQSFFSSQLRSHHLCQANFQKPPTTLTHPNIYLTVIKYFVTRSQEFINTHIQIFFK